MTSWLDDTRLHPTKGFATRGLYTIVGFSFDCLHIIFDVLGAVHSALRGCSAHPGERRFSKVSPFFLLERN